jgi:hypothetical protein
MICIRFKGRKIHRLIIASNMLERVTLAWCSMSFIWYIRIYWSSTMSTVPWVLYSTLGYPQFYDVHEINTYPTDLSLLSFRCGGIRVSVTYQYLRDRRVSSWGTGIQPLTVISWYGDTVRCTVFLYTSLLSCAVCAGSNGCFPRAVRGLECNQRIPEGE